MNRRIRRRVVACLTARDTGCPATRGRHVCSRERGHDGQHCVVVSFGGVALWWADPPAEVIVDQVMAEAAALASTGATTDEVRAFARAGRMDAQACGSRS